MADDLTIHASQAVDVDDDTLPDRRAVGAVRPNLVGVEVLGLEELGFGGSVLAVAAINIPARNSSRGR